MVVLVRDTIDSPDLEHVSRRLDYSPVPWRVRRVGLLFGKIELLSSEPAGGPCARGGMAKGIDMIDRPLGSHLHVPCSLCSPNHARTAASAISRYLSEGPLLFVTAGRSACE